MGRRERLEDRFKVWPNYWWCFQSLGIVGIVRIKQRITAYGPRDEGSKGQAGGLRPNLALLTHEGTLKGCLFCLTTAQGRGRTLVQPLPCFYVCGLFFVVINGGQV